MNDKLNRENIKLENAEEALGHGFFIKLKQIEGRVMLDHSIFAFFELCRQINEILSEHNLFLRFYEE